MRVRRRALIVLLLAATTAGLGPVAAADTTSVPGRDGIVAPPVRPANDFDGDGRTDFAVFRPSNGTWYMANGLTYVFGAVGDVPVPGDYNGDGRSEVAVFRPTTGSWYVLGQSTSVFGVADDIPVPADYNGDGRTDIAVFRPSTGTWFVQGGLSTVFGDATDVPVPADYNGDGRTDIAVFRPSNGTWYVQGGVTSAFGNATDVPVPADYTGDRRADIAVFRPSTGAWILQGAAGTTFGAPDDAPVAGDYNGDGRADLAVFRPSTGTWYVHDGSPSTFGTATDVRIGVPPALFRYYGPYRLMVTVSPSTGGTVTGANGISCPAACTSSFARGQVVPLGTTANPGWVFWQWHEGCTGTSCSVQMDGPRSVWAEYAQGTAICPGNTPQVKHTNGVGQGQIYYHCNPLGTPGDAATYTLSMATAAAQAWDSTATVTQVSCMNGAMGLLAQRPGSAVVWAYSAATAGRVLLSTMGPFCPAASSPSWN